MRSLTDRKLSGSHWVVNWESVIGWLSVGGAMWALVWLWNDLTEHWNGWMCGTCPGLNP